MSCVWHIKNIYESKWKAMFLKVFWGHPGSWRRVSLTSYPKVWFTDIFWVILPSKPASAPHSLFRWHFYNPDMIQIISEHGSQKVSLTREWPFGFTNKPQIDSLQHQIQQLPTLILQTLYGDHASINISGTNILLCRLLSVSVVCIAHERYDYWKNPNRRRSIKSSRSYTAA
jgi:hypothetical protein